MEIDQEKFTELTLQNNTVSIFIMQKDDMILIDKKIVAEIIKVLQEWVENDKK